jgi:hypothetical protein
LSYIDDFINQNAGAMTRDQIITSLKAAGYDQREINGALRRSRSRPTESVRGPKERISARPPDRPVDPVLAYIRQHRELFAREALRQQLLLAGHSAATIEGALMSSDAELRADTRRLEGKFGLLRPIAFIGVLLYVALQVLPTPVFALLMGGSVIAGGLVWLKRSGRI